MHLAHVGTVVLAAFLASIVEFVEALTIVLAVGTVRGWRPALIGAGAGTAFLALLVLAFGPALARVPIATLQLVIGVLLLLFGMRWLRKAILRSAGVIGLHDETAIFAEESAALRAGIGRSAGRPGLDGVAVATAFKAVTLEGLEVIFIVIAAGAGGMLVAATVGAAVAGALVILAGLALHRPLARVPENTLKFGVGLLLSAFGVFWTGEGLGFPWPGEGLGFPWPGEDLSLFALLAGFLAVSLLAVAVAKGRAAPTAPRLGKVTP